MREILFRGKRIDNGDWVYGSLIRMDDEGYQTFIFPPYNYASSLTCGQLVAYGMIAVIPETVGQYTGLKDKNGVKIFEGDILKDSLGWVCLVKWDDSNGRFLGYHKKPRGDTYVCYVGREPASEVIGNIHDNPELMEAQNDH